MKDFLNGLNWVCVLSIVIAIEQQIGNGSMSLAHMFPDAWLPAIKVWCANLATIGLMIVSYGAYGPRPAQPAPPSPAAKPSITGLVLLLGAGLMLALLAGPASAQTRKPQFTGNLIADVKANNAAVGDDIKAKIAQFEAVTIADLTAAKQIFDAAKNANGSACAAAWLALAQANATIDAATLPDPHLFSFLAKAYNLHVALQPGASLRTACAAMKDDLNGGLLGIGGGAAAVTKLVPALAMFGL